jgi:hypothetical protein
VVIALAPHLAGCEHDQVDLEVSLKDTGGPDQKLHPASLASGTGAPRGKPSTSATLIMPSRRCI